MKKLVKIIVILFVFSIASATITCYVTWKNSSIDYKYEALRFSESMSHLYKNLDIDQSSKVVIISYGADQVVYLPAFVSKTELSNAGIAGAIHSYMYSLSQNDQKCPALIWLKNNTILSVQPLQIKAGMDFPLTRWTSHNGSIFLTVLKKKTGNIFPSLILQ